MTFSDRLAYRIGWTFTVGGTVTLAVIVSAIQVAAFIGG